MSKFISTIKNLDKNPIKDLVLAVTYKCNSRCRFCNIWQNQEFFSCEPIDYINLPRNIKNVNISGGEPFLRQDLPEIIKNISRQCPKAKIVISTNGFLPSKIKETMQRIIKFKKNIGVAVSLDGFGKVHEELRGFPGGFSLALETIRLLKELGIRDLKISFTLGNENINQLKKVYQLSKELKTEFSLAVYHNSSHYFKKQDNKIYNLRSIEDKLNWLISQELRSFSPKKWFRAYFTYGTISFLKNKQRILPDSSGLDSLFIDPFGNIYPSNVWDLKIGQLSKIEDWDEFSKRTKKIVLTERKPVSWMICIARQSMRKNWFKVIRWILQEKFCLFTNGKRYIFQSRKKTPIKQTGLLLKRIASFFI